MTETRSLFAAQQRARHYSRPARSCALLKRVNRPDAGNVDVFVHISAVEEAGLNILTKGQKVEYEVVSQRDGKTAAGNLKLVD